MNISAESMIFSIDEGFAEQFGYTDIILKENRTWGSFDYNEMEDLLYDIDSVEIVVPRIVMGRTVRINVSETTDRWCDIVALNDSHPYEREFGKIIVNQTTEEYENYTQIEDFLGLPGMVCTVSRDFASYYGLSVGDDIFIHASDMWALGQNWWITSTWSTFKIVAIIIDSGESCRDFQPPVNEPWELEPSGWAIYLSLDEALQYVFNTNGNNVTYANIHLKDFDKIDETINEIYSRLLNSAEFGSLEFYQANAKEVFQGSIKQFSSIIISLFTIISFLALLVSAILIKNLMEMNTQSHIYYTGILRSMGSSKFKIFRIFFTELTVISVIGMGLGLLLGVFMSNFFVDKYGTMLSNSGVISELVFLGEYHMEVIITPQPLIYGLIGGLTIPILFGIIPILKAVNIKIIKAIKPDMFTNGTHRGLQFGKLLIGISISVILIVTGYFASKYGFQNAFTIYSSFPDTGALIYVIVGFMCLVLGVILLGTKVLPGISSLVTYISFFILGKLRRLTHKNVIRNKKQTKNTFAMLSLGLSLLVTLSLVLNSMSAGAYPGSKTQIGGDILVGNPWGYMNAEVDVSESIQGIEGVVASCPIKEFWSKMDDFGYSDTNNPLGYQEELYVYVVNVTQYRRLISSKDMFKIISDPRNVLPDEILSELEKGGKIILQEEVKQVFDKTVGENVSLEVSSVTRNLTICGFAEALPGLREIFWTSDTRIRITALVSIDDFLDIMHYSAFLVNVESRNVVQSVIASIEDLYLDLGITWSKNDVTTAENEMNYLLTVVGMIQSVFQSVFSFALVISLLGLIISMLISVNKRKSEIGTMRAIGGSKFQMIKLIFGETLVISFMGIFIGICTGLLISFIIVNNIGFIPMMPMVFSVPVEFLVNLSLILAGVSISTSIIPAYSAMKFDIIEAIRNIE